VRFGTRSWHPAHNEMEIARAAAIVAIHPGEVVGSFDASTTWFTTGAHAYYPLWRDVSYATDLQALNVLAYLRRFPSLAESNQPEVNGGTSISYWASHGLLKARGFYFDRPFSARVRLRYVLYSRVPHAIRGAARTSRGVVVFSPSSVGGWSFVSATCVTSAVELPALGRWSIVANVPRSVGVPPPTEGKRRLIATYVMRKALARRIVRSLPRSCRVLQEQRLTARVLGLNDLLAEARAAGADRTIGFPTWVPAVEALYGPPGRVLKVPRAGVSGAPRGGSEARVDLTRQTVELATSGRAYATAATIPLSLPLDRSALWLRVRLRVSRGTLGVCVIDVARKVCPLQRRVVGSDVRMPTWVRVPDVRGTLALYIENGATGRADASLTRHVDVAQLVGRTSESRGNNRDRSDVRVTHPTR